MVTTIDGKPEIGDQQAVEDAAQEADADADGEQSHRSEAGLRRIADAHRGQCHDRGDRQVDLAHQDEQRHRERDDRLFGEIEGRVGEVEDVEEIGRDHRVHDDRRGEQHDEDDLPAQQHVAQRRGAASRTA